MVNDILDSDLTATDAVALALSRGRLRASNAERVGEDLAGAFGDDTAEVAARGGDDGGGFIPQGIDIEAAGGLSILRQQNPAIQNYYDDLLESTSGNIDFAEELLEEAVESGANLPTRLTANADTVLYRVQPIGETVSDFTPYWVTADELAEAVNTGNLPDRLGLPQASVASEYNFFEIRPRPGQTPNYYQSQIAPTIENGISHQGGAIQSLVPNRSQWTEPQLITLDPNSL